MPLPNFKLDLDSAFLRKLLETTASGVGAVAGAWLKKRDAHAVADALRIEAQGHRDAQDILSGKKTLSSKGEVVTASQNTIELTAQTIEENEIQARLSFQEKKRQDNIKAIFDKAAQDNKGDVADKPVDPDWIAKFFTYAQDVSNEEMQTLWAKLLADEVKNPGSCSIRTLEILKNLSKSDAANFEKIRPFMIGNFIPSDETILKKHGITLNMLVELEDAGLVNTGFGRSNQFGNMKVTEKFLAAFTLNQESALIIEHENPNNVFSLASHQLTAAARELNRILPASPLNFSFLKEVCETQKANGYSFKLAKLNGNLVELGRAETF